MNSIEYISDYEIVNKRKLKKCKENQVRNPITKRCVLKTSKIAKKLNNLKICPENKILNYKTNKCVLKTGKIGKKIINELNNIKYKKLKKIIKKKQINNLNANVNTDVNEILIKNIKEYFYPFVNRVSAKIYDRKLYYLKLMKHLKFNNKLTSYCIKPHTLDNIFIISNTNIFFKHINNDLNIGFFNDKKLKLYNFAINITIDNFVSKHDISIYDKLTTALINEECPHFPFYYTSLKCNNIDISKISQLPPIIKYNQNEKFIFILTELYNGNFADFIKKYYTNTRLLTNAIAQIFISLLFMYNTIHSFHKNASWSSFLYHKIKPGGVFHYKIFNNDYYIENIGFLWVINEFRLTTLFNSSMTTTVDNDFNKFNYEFKNTKINDKLLLPMLNEKIINFHDKLLSLHYSYFLLHKYSKNNINKLINKIMYLLTEYNFISKTFNTTIINNKPYVIEKFT